MSRLRAIPLVAMAAICVMAACSSGNGSANPAQTTSTALETSTTLNPERAAVLEAYRGFRRAFEAASNPMNPEHPDLGRYATGDELRTVTGAFLARKSAGEIFKGTVELAPVVKELEGDRAIIRDCIFDRMGVYDAANPDRLKEPMDTARVLEMIALVKTPEGWKVEDIKKEAEGCDPEA